MKKVLIILSLFVINAAHAAQEIKLGFVDLERTVREVVDGVKARDELKREFDQKQKLLDVKQNDIKKLQTSLEAGGALMKPNVKEEQTAKLQKLIMETQQLYMGMQQEMQRREADMMNAILQKTNTVVQAIAEKENMTYVLEKKAVLFGKQHQDLTNEVIRKYNEIHAPKLDPKKKAAEKKNAAAPAA